MGDTQQSQETHQQINAKQLLVLVRFKPGGLDTAAAGSLLGSVSNPIDSAVGAIESAAASIPGLNMFITEEKNNSSSEKEYNYYKDYSDWDKFLDNAKSNLNELNKENDTLKFEFSSTDAEGRKKDAKELQSKIKAKFSAWKKYTAYIHFIGLAQGGNVINECSDLLAKDNDFKNEKWSVRSVIYLAVPLYKNEHVFNKESLKGQGSLTSFGNLYDLTQGGVGYFDDNDKLLTLITDSNKNVLSLAVGKVKLRLVKVLAIALGGLQISVGPDALKDLDKIDQVKDEIKGMIDDMVGFMQKLVSEGTSFVKLPDIPDFKKISDDYGDIPGRSVTELTQAIDDIKNKAIDGAKHTSLSLGPSDLAGIFNALCPLFDAVSQSFGVLKPDTKGGEDLATQIIDSAGIKKVFAPSADKPTYLPLDKDYIAKAVEAAKKNEPDMAGSIVLKVQEHITKATENTNDVKQMSAEEKMHVAQAIACLSLPMLPTKKDFYAKLINLLPFDLNKLTEDMKADKLMGAAGKPLEAIGIKFTDKLNQSVANTDAEMSRVKGYFDKNNFKLADKKDALYLIYNSHNLTLKKVPDELKKYLDEQTGYATMSKKENAIPTQPVPEKT